MIAIPHPIRRKIEDQYDFLCSMLNRFPHLLNAWIKQQVLEVQNIAKETSEGDSEIYSTVYQSEISRFDSCYEEEQLFNQAMFIMAYSYYESILNRIAKELEMSSSDARPSLIAKKVNVEILDSCKEVCKYLYCVIRPIRNQLCHNNNGTFFEREDKDVDADGIKALVTEGSISIEDKQVYIINRKLIQDVLDKEHQILLYLADICSYKTRFV